MKHFLYSSVFLWLIASTVVNAQPIFRGKPEQINSKEKHWQQNIHVGLNIGATAPWSMPNTVRKINSWSPNINPSFGYEIIYTPKEKWSYGASLKLCWKGMSSTDEVQYFHTLINVEDGGKIQEFEGDFSGKNKTNISNFYLELPIYAIYHLSKKTNVKIGGYVALLLNGKFSGEVSDGYIRKGNSLGEKLNITSASFDFGDKQNKLDYGIVVGGSHKVSKKLFINADIDLGLATLFPSSFKGVDLKLHNFYLNLGIGYQL